jgi:spore germination protein
MSAQMSANAQSRHQPGAVGQESQPPLQARLGTETDTGQESTFGGAKSRCAFAHPPLNHTHTHTCPAANMHKLPSVLLLLLPALALAKVSLLGYYTGDSDSIQMLESADIDAVAFDAGDVDKMGRVTHSTYSQGLAYANAHNMSTFLTVSNWGAKLNDFDPKIAHAVLRNAKARARALQGLVAASAAYGGINVDFEAVPKQDRLFYSTFIETLAARLHAKNRTLMISLPAMEQDSPSDSWLGAFDFARLGKAVDVMQIMTYDENGPWGPPGPVAALDWVERCINYTATVVPLHKISQGMNAYGYDWFGNSGVTVSYKDIPALVASTKATPIFDAASASYTFQYTQAHVSHTVWFDSAASIQMKAAFAGRKGVGGISVWSIGQEDISFWNGVRAGLAQSG